MRGAVSVPMVKVGIVWMTMHEARMAMPVRMRLARWIGRDVLMTMVRVVTMPVFVLHRLVDVLVIVPLGQVQPEAQTHEDAGHEENDRQRVVQ